MAKRLFVLCALFVACGVEHHAETQRATTANPQGYPQDTLAQLSAHFKSKWMTDRQLAKIIEQFGNDDVILGGWSNPAKLTAVLEMHEVIGAEKEDGKTVFSYLQFAADAIAGMLDNRDDRHDPPRVDELRGVAMPGFAMRSDRYAYHRQAHFVYAANMLHVIGQFIRHASRTASLRSRFGPAIERFTNEFVEIFTAYYKRDWRNTRRDGIQVGYWVYPKEAVDMLCTDRRPNRSGLTSTELLDCRKKRLLAKQSAALPLNMQALMGSALLEFNHVAKKEGYSRVLNKTLAYIKSLLVADGDSIVWPYSELQASKSLEIEPGRREDTSHANLVVEFFTKAVRFKKAMGLTSNPLSTSQLRRLGNTFVDHIASKCEFASHLYGKVSRSFVYNKRVHGWAAFARFDKSAPMICKKINQAIKDYPAAMTHRVYARLMMNCGTPRAILLQ